MSGHHRVIASAWLAAALGACASSPTGQSVALANGAAVPKSADSVVGQEGERDSKDSGPLARTAVQGPDRWPPPVHDDQSFTFLRAEQLEYRARESGPDVARWEVQGWHGGDYQRLWIKTEGEQTVEGASEGELEVQALYGQVVAPFWDFQVGARYDRRSGSGIDNDRWLGVVGVQGLSPYEFEVEAALFISEEADVSARLTTATDILITQRLILQPRFETEIAVQDVPEFQVGQGLNHVELGLRLRYEFQREVAPYIGLNWNRRLGETKEFVQRNGGDANDLALVFGMSLWF